MINVFFKNLWLFTSHNMCPKSPTSFFRQHPTFLCLQIWVWTALLHLFFCLSTQSKGKGREKSEHLSQGILSRSHPIHVWKYSHAVHSSWVTTSMQLWFSYCWEAGSLKHTFMRPVGEIFLSLGQSFYRTSCLFSCIVYQSVSLHRG